MTPTENVRLRFAQAMSRIAHFWGFPKATGAAYAAIYLSPDPMSLDQIVEAVGLSKGALSIHLRTLERIGVVHRESRPADRRDFYAANTDFWTVIRRILHEREKRELDRALRTVRECLDSLPASADARRAPLVDFYRDRLVAMQRFFDALDRVVGAFLALEDLRHGALERLIAGRRRPTPRRRP
jgi:DNA-binding transcriptional regulator GbsR (MarR family)